MDLDRDKLPTERALGLPWGMGNGELRFNIIVKDKSRTSRNIQ